MWTPKRVVLLIVGFCVFVAAYLTYARFLGGIDGLPQLPECYRPGSTDQAGSDPKPLPIERTNGAITKLQMAFGPDSDAPKRMIKLEIQPRGLVLAADQFEIKDDGRVMLQPFRIAIFGKAVGDSGTPEINTVSSEVAYLTFDSPIKNMAEVGSRKIVASELVGNVNIVNNRRSPRRDDDMSLFTQGPVFYQENQNHIWTDAVVRLEDLQSKPQPTTISAVGMDVYLLTDNPPATAKPAPARKSRMDSVSGVEKVCLRSGVEMHLFDSQSGFLSTGKTAKPERKPGAAAPAAAPPAPAQPDKAHVVITTEGPVVYDVVKDRAQFDISQRPSFSPKRVSVTREHEPGKWDQLDCDRLELQFSRNPPAKAAGQPPNAPDAHSGLSIDTAHATSRADREVILTSDAETLEAHGNDLLYGARTHTSILKGEPNMYAVKEGNIIYARELQLLNQPGGQQATALGPGTIDMLDKKTGKRPLHARWRDTLVSSKEGTFDCLTLTGEAAFEDREHDQQLRGDVLKVWLQPSEHGPAADAAAEHVRPHHVEAKGHVTAVSTDMYIKDPTDHLILWFKDVATKAELPKPAPGGGYVSGKPGEQEPPPPPAQSPTGTAAQPAVPPSKPKTPIQLSARSVEVYVFRSDVKNVLDRLYCEGTVLVHQDPGSPEEKGVDIQGETLQLNHSLEGHVLVVTGNLAEVHLDKMRIHGPEVTIDQKTNVARVNGMGIMNMPSTASFGDPKKPDQPAPKKPDKPEELTVRWKKDMFFNGKHAWFQGDIQADQGTGRLLCQDMQVILDHPVSFREGEKGHSAAKVERLICDKNVYLEEKTLEGPRLVGRQRLSSPTVAVDNEYGLVNAGGPGVVYILQLGDAGETDLAQPPGKTAPARNPPQKKQPGSQTPPQELKLTEIKYLQRLSADNNKRTAKFFGNVEVMRVPVSQSALLDGANLEVDKDRPPPGFMYLRCEQLKVFTRMLADNKKSQQMEAERNCIVRAENFWGTAAVVKYDEEQDRVIFEAGAGSLAVLYRATIKGAQYDKITGQKIYYWRQTNNLKVEEGHGMNGMMSGNN